ncbi:MAG: tyrosine-type recombinase/integrase [Alphaproteobacteria bacterium]|nr:tyrosine-type recombinase/integrase [Alphaproteobacteria bacterium]
MTNEEIGLLFDTVEAEHTFLYMMIAFTTGARPGAILDLTRERVDIDGGTINLLPVGQVQNKKRRPVVPICNTLRPWLILAGQTYVIEYQGQRVDNNRQAITRLAARAGLKGVSRYTIRHTVATELRERGLSDWDIATLLGHQDPNRRTTEGYAKSRDRTRSRIAAAIDAWFSEIQQHTKRPLILDPATAAQEIQALRGNCVGKLAA